MQITTIGLDIAKNVFQLHGIDAEEKVVVRKQLRRHHVIRFLRNSRRALLGWRSAPRRTIGAENSPGSVLIFVQGLLYPRASSTYMNSVDGNDANAWLVQGADAQGGAFFRTIR